MRIKAKDIKLRIDEATFSSAKNVIKIGDTISAVKNTKAINYLVKDILQTPYGPQYVLTITLKKDNKERTVLATPSSYENGNLTMELVRGPKNKIKFTLLDVLYLNIIRKGKVIERIDGKADTSVNDTKGKDSKNDRQQEETVNFNEELSKLKPGDLFTISTGDIDKNGNIKRNTITDLNFNVESIGDGKVFLSVNSIEGKDSARYKGLDRWEDITISNKSYKFGQHAATIVLELLGGGKSEIYAIDNVFSYESKDGEGEVTKDETPGESGENEKSIADVKRKEAAILNNPRLRNALVGKENVIQKALGIDNVGAFMSIIKRLKGLGANIIRMKRGNDVRLTLLSSDIKGETIQLLKNRSYRAKIKNEYTLVIGTQNAVERFIIELVSETKEEDTYNVLVKLQNISKKEIISEKKYKGIILVNDYNY